MNAAPVIERSLAIALTLIAASCITTHDVGLDDHYTAFSVGRGVTCRVPIDDEDPSTVRCLGTNDRGQMMTPSTDFDEVCNGLPCTSIPSWSTFVSDWRVAQGIRFGCGTTSDGLNCFGDNQLGQMGMGFRDSVEHSSPEYVVPDGRPRDFGVGRHHACELSRSGLVYCWGVGTHGELGRDPATLDACATVNDAKEAAEFGTPIGGAILCDPTPEPIANIRGVTDLWVGDFGTCFRDEDREVLCVGRNVAGALGLEQAVDETSFPRRSRHQDATQMVLGPRHGCALRPSGELVCFGENELGQLGASEGAHALDDVRDVAIGDDVTWALDAASHVYAFGSDAHAELGDGPSSPDLCGVVPCARRPVRVALPHAAVVLRGAGSHACALTSDDRLMCWGDGSTGAIGDSLHLDAATPIELRNFQPP
jgi:alpha-tubulin suppressor-like RCC1 family protein